MREKRTTRRVSGRIEVTPVGRETAAYITDLSREGAYVQSASVPRVGSPFRFRVANGNAAADLSARVVRARDAFVHGGSSGFGIRFENLEGTGKALRDDLLLYLMNQRFQSIWGSD